jgi:hypothetical protein
MSRCVVYIGMRIMLCLIHMNVMNGKLLGLIYRYMYGHIILNLEVCISISPVYGKVTPAVIVTVSNKASYLHDNHLVLAIRRNQRPYDFPNGQL